MVLAGKAVQLTNADALADSAAHALDQDAAMSLLREQVDARRDVLTHLHTGLDTDLHTGTQAHRWFATLSKPSAQALSLSNSMNDNLMLRYGYLKYC